MSIHIIQYVNGVHDIQNVILNQVSTWCIHPSLYISIHWKQTSMTTRHASSYSNDKNRKQNWIKSFFASFELRNLTNPYNSKLPSLRKICNITFPWVTSTGSFSTSMEKLCTETGQVAEKSKVCREGDAASAVDVESGRCCACSCHNSKGEAPVLRIFFESKKVTKWYLFTKGENLHFSITST